MSASAGRRRCLGFACAMLAALGCATRRPDRVNDRGSAEWGEGLASYYGPGLAGRKTANGEILDPTALTGAHRRLPFGTCVHVLNLRTGSTVEVRINDRGPYAGNRILDVTVAAARHLEMVESGVARVRLSPCENR